jgi:hypothetical protein
VPEGTASRHTMQAILNIVESPFCSGWCHDDWSNETDVLDADHQAGHHQTTDFSSGSDEPADFNITETHRAV